MKPKQKAEELFDRYSVLIPIDASFNDAAEEARFKMVKDHLITKHCALIAVNEILRIYRKGVVDSEYNKGFWGSVKNELLKM